MEDFVTNVRKPKLGKSHNENYLSYINVQNYDVDSITPNILFYLKKLALFL